MLHVLCSIFRIFWEGEVHVLTYYVISCTVTNSKLVFRYSIKLLPTYLPSLLMYGMVCTLIHTSSRKIFAWNKPRVIIFFVTGRGRGSTIWNVATLISTLTPCTWTLCKWRRIGTHLRMCSGSNARNCTNYSLGVLFVTRKPKGSAMNAFEAIVSACCWSSVYFDLGRLLHAISVSD